MTIQNPWLNSLIHGVAFILVIAISAWVSQNQWVETVSVGTVITLVLKYIQSSI